MGGSGGNERGRGGVVYHQAVSLGLGCVQPEGDREVRCNWDVNPGGMGLTEWEWEWECDSFFSRDLGQLHGIGDDAVVILAPRRHEEAVVRCLTRRLCQQQECWQPRPLLAYLKHETLRGNRRAMSP